MNQIISELNKSEELIKINKNVDEYDSKLVNIVLSVYNNLSENHIESSNINTRINQPNTSLNKEIYSDSTPTISTKKCIIQTRNPDIDLYEDTILYYRSIFDQNINYNNYDLLDSIKYCLPESYVPFNLIELKSAIKAYPNNKSPGIDQITKEILMIYIDSPFIYHLLNLFNLCYYTCITPKRWNTTLILPIPKTKDSTYIDEFRPISITVFFRRIFENLLKNRYFNNKFIDLNISKYQTGFRSDYSVSTQIIYLNDSYAVDKLNIKMFIDFKNAYDSVIIDRLILKLHSILDPRAVKLIRSLFSNGKLIVKINEGYTSYFNRSNGLFQGSILSPYLFNIYINDLCIDLNRQFGINKSIFYADDLVMISNSKVDLYNKLRIIDQWSSKNNIYINVAKSGVIGSTFFVLDNFDIIDEVKEYKYLGILFDYDGMKLDYMIPELQSKSKGIMAFTSLNNSNLSNDEKIQIFKTFILPYFNMYGPLFYYTTLRNPEYSKVFDKDINELNKEIMNWIFSSNTIYYSILNSVSGILRLNDLIKLISIRFKYNFINIVDSHAIHELISNLKSLGKYDKNLLTYKVQNYSIRNFDNSNFNLEKTAFLKQVNNFKLNTLNYGTLSKYISCRRSNGMDKVIKIKNTVLRHKLINWRRNKTYTNMISATSSKPFNRKIFNDEIYLKLEGYIPYKHKENFHKLRKEFPRFYTIIDYLVNISEYELAEKLINVTKSFLKGNSRNTDKIRDEMS